MEHFVDATLTVNGTPVSRRVATRQHLIDFLREEMGLTGSHVGCEHGVCGACTIRVNGEIVRGCLMLACQASGKQVDTIEGLSDSGEIADLQEAFHERNALQCGYCTPGMLMTAKEHLDRHPDGGTDEEIREAIAGVLCRCTGYQQIIESIRAAATTGKGA